ncbi:hypothetical protein H6F86_13615 [Phormidium sp. FACHB-592]|uniref:Tc1-like transposase DDE domain-containing protein n=1 Tax=Stenomitos frigidus AS-A4 TaxID=2933935 RepID=A0ABV0KNI8_9CYAN|nr:hypothetical protein [Phormidium sp. FACHB-592]MBD2074914.1 hypothetical protein [Phormidium sp. FACHB-592]
MVKPATGKHFFYEFTYLNSNCFQVFLGLGSERYKGYIFIMQLDQAGVHRAKRLQIPTNMIFMFQPCHTLGINPYALSRAKPYERVWQHFKLGLRWKLPKDIDTLRLLMRIKLEAMT